MRNFLMPALMLTATLSLVACSGNSTPAPTNTAPVANFSVTPTSGPAALTVTTTNSSSDADAGETATLTYDVDWGDSTAHATTPSTTHTYTAAGTYTVTLTATDIKSASNSKTAVVTVTTTAPVAPTILNVSPADASLGNLVNNTANTAGAPIVITFSTPMDVVATQAAYQSASVGLNPGAGNVTFGWSAGNTVLTITPNLALPFTTQFATVAPGVPISYTYTINSGAKSAAGLLITAPKTVTFSTFVKHISVPFGSDATDDTNVTNLTGSFTTSAGSSSTEMLIGDNVPNQPTAAYLSFPLTSLPTTVKSANISAAILTVKSSGTNGFPYTPVTGLITATKKLSLYSLYYGSTVTVGDLQPTNELASNLDGTALTMSPSVLSAVQTDWTNRVAQSSRSQYQLRFPKLTNGDSFADQQKIWSVGAALGNRPKLELTYTDDN